MGSIAARMTISREIRRNASPGQSLECSYYTGEPMEKQIGANRAEIII
jgi:IS30 family transposase